MGANSRGQGSHSGFQFSGERCFSCVFLPLLGQSALQFRYPESISTFIPLQLAFLSSEAS